MGRFRVGVFGTEKSRRRSHDLEMCRISSIAVKNGKEVIGQQNKGDLIDHHRPGR